MRGETAAEGSTLSWFSFRSWHVAVRCTIVGARVSCTKRILEFRVNPCLHTSCLAGRPRVSNIFFRGVGSRAGRAAQVPTALSFTAKGAETVFFTRLPFFTSSIKISFYLAMQHDCLPFSYPTSHAIPVHKLFRLVQYFASAMRSTPTLRLLLHSRVLLA